jgi:ribulose-5-phosphate 4-epimerase/fuculose-1-phosphate aldolase
MVEEGYVKFNYDWEKKPIAIENFGELNRYRNKLYKLGLIGVFENGIGFGNISIRLGESNLFIISGTRTGALASLSEKHYSKVVEFDFERSWLRCIGLVVASSESLSHARIYQLDREANAVIHVHSMNMWKRLLGKVPETGKHADCGTPELAEEISRLFRETEVMEKKIIVTAGHKEGIISFGKDLEEAYNILLKYFKG